MKFIVATFLAVFVSAPALGQEVRARTHSDAPGSGPSAISGMASSARHCVSGDAANVHAIGWMDIGTAYTITFDAEFPLVTVVSRLDLTGDGDSVGSVGTPDFRATSSTAGTMALYVGATGAGGCYRYKVELTPPAGAAASTSVGSTPVKLSTDVATPAAITGFASSAKHCVAGSYVANVHDIGRVERGNLITISFDSDFDPVAGVTLENLSTLDGTYVVNDDGGGSLQPQLHFTASHSSTLALFVGGYNGSAGCYRYKVEIR
jgi:hypothetical protein